MKKKEISTFSKIIQLIGFIGVLIAILVSSFSLSLKILLTSIFLLLWERLKNGRFVYLNVNNIKKK